MSAIRYVVLSLLGAGGACFAPSATAQVVQLPSYNVTGVGTTVSVPDGGEAYLGGIYRLSEGSSTRGVPFLPFKNRTIGRAAGASTMSVRATIVDHAAMDEALLAEAAARRAARPYGPYRVDPLVAAEAKRLSAHIARSPASESPGASDAGLPRQAAPGDSFLRAPHGAATVHGSAAARSAAAATLADRLLRSEVEVGEGARSAANSRASGALP